jgi:GTPase
MTRPHEYKTDVSPKTLILGIDAPYNHTRNISSYFDEFISLVNTHETSYDHELFIKLRTVDASYFLTKGKLLDLKKIIEEEKIEKIIISEALSVQQERNLTAMLNCTICDRTRLILEIFEKSAHSAEGKTQVAIALLHYERSRLAGKGIHMSQQKGSIGLRGGFGETLKEREKRHIENTLLKLERQLDRLKQIRETQRKKRLNTAIPQICLIGYTNSGKSTILNALTKSNVLAENKLFATLDTTTRKLFISGKEKGLLSDTVGFIQQLPHHLIAAFKSTLAELEYADLLLHVIDISDKNWESHIEVVTNILAELGINKQILYVFNKSDKVDNIEAIKTAMERYEPYVMTDALSKEGLELLIEFLDQWKKSPPLEVH